MSELKVSAIVPVFDPGAAIDDCIASLVQQSLPRDEYEVIFVDDGSTDGTADRLDALAAQHPHVRVEHIEASGWSARPRNVGLEMARGEFVYFVDNDDWVERDALERLHAVATRDRADVVVGKVVGHGKYVPAGLFRESRSGATLENAPLLGLLTPHKLFRRSFLDAHAIRFPEGRRRLEDHVFVLRAYFNTDRVSILADRPCYHWVRRGAANASYAAWDPVEYYASLRAVLDIVDEHRPPGAERDRLYLHWYRGKTLGRVSGHRAPLRHPLAWRRRVFDEVRAITLERFAERLDAQLPLNLRVRAALVRAGDWEGMQALARFEAALRGHVALTGASIGDDDRLTLRLRGTLGPGLRLRDVDGRTLWEPPPELAGRLDEAALDAGDVAPRIEVALRSLGDRSEHALAADAAGARDGDRVEVELMIDPARAAAGAPLPAGDYDLPATVSFAGFTAPAVAARSRVHPPAVVRVRDGRADVRPTSGRAAGLALARRWPRLARAVKRAVRR